MMTNFCFGLTCLLIPALIELFNLQTALQLSTAGHSMVEALILCGFYWLLVQILHLDEQLYLRNLLKQRPPEPMTIQPHAQEMPIKMMPTMEASRTAQSPRKAAHGLWLTLGALIKSHRTVKPL